MTANLTRRRMLAAAGIGTAAAAFSGAASAQCRNDLKWDETHEIVVVGAGGAGMAAAVKAAQTGAKDILVLEKLAFTGGNTLIAQGFINAADPVRQPHQGIKDSPENHMKQTLAAGDFRGDPERVKVLCDNAYGAITWLESLGMKFKDNVIQIFGALYPRSHIPALPKGQGYGTVLTKAAKELGVQVRTGLGVTEIIREEQFAGRVIGVKVQPAKGPARFIRATKAVVLAAGGFSGNRYLRELHDPRVKGLGTDNLPGSTGEVAMAAVRVGAYLVGMDFIQSTPGAPAGKKMKLLLNFNVNGSIYVDKRGNRIVNEGERRDVIRDAVLGTPERYGYTVCDNTNFMSYDAVNRKAIMEGIKINEAWTAPTIRELAEKMGVDPDGLEKTIKRYNEVFVKNGRDDDFHKQPVNLTKRIEDGPFWACYTGMTVHHTMGGINTNVKAQALDWEGKVIPGLYAAGEITGGIHGTNRVGGNAVLDCFVFGQIAGENAAKEVACRVLQVSRLRSAGRRPLSSRRPASTSRMRTSPPHACTPARPDPRSSNGPAGRRTERGRFFTEPALHFHLQLFPHRPESCSCTSEVITPLSHCMAGSRCPRSCQTSFGTHFFEHSSGSGRILNSSVPATSRASVSEQVKQRSERLTICTALKKYGVLTARGLAIQASETDASIALSTHSGPGRTSTYLCARHSSSVSAPASSNLRASE